MNEQIKTVAGAPLFNPLAPEFIANPYPYYHRLRETDPMHLTPLGFYVASRHADIPRSCATSASARTLSAG